ncbi:cbb3-type cytochrome oxidase assembly protein CcoS [Spiribacter insolitus]|uniref:Cbb3-type cytochrome oxidase assembly protein CcoS n=1 Tax=Spiribacter insolitus TaxID=3122417 RepID=A0ABV3TA07_9GAMM
MNILFILIPLGVMLLGFAVAAFIWAVSNGQYDDLDSPAWRILLDDDRRPPEQGNKPSDLPPADPDNPSRKDGEPEQ